MKKLPTETISAENNVEFTAGLMLIFAEAPRIWELVFACGTIPLSDQASSV
jgi:hypothetical protein